MPRRSQPHAIVTVSLPIDLHTAVLRIGERRRHKSTAETVRALLKERVLQLIREATQERDAEIAADLERVRIRIENPESVPAPPESSRENDKKAPPTSPAQ